ncbi:MAG: hypothetical protein EB110_00415 [Betaproteobacteria bacterium]|nr:hypothetical protein [Betaproteobacteria bacterium]
MNANLFWNNRGITYVVLTLVFGTFYALNNVVTAPLLLAPGAHLVHLPSGFKLLLVLVFGMVGALSVFTVSLVAGLGFYFVGELPLSIELAIANAIAPFLTVKFFLDQQLVQPDLNDLRPKVLALMGLLYAVLNSAMNQLLLFWNHAIQNMVDGLMIMFTGDVLGVILVLGLLRLAMRWAKRKMQATEDSQLPPAP